MAKTQGKATPEQRARTLRFWVEGGMPLSPEDAAWLKAYEAAEKKRQDKAMKVSKEAEKKAGAKAKREKRVVTPKDLAEACQPATPATRGRAIPAEVIEARAALDVALQNAKSVETLAHARALALAALPRNRTKKRQVSQLCRIGKTDWLSVTYTAMDRGVDLAFGADLLAILAIVDRVARSGQTRLEFTSLRDLVASLEGSIGGRQAELALERLQRAAGTGISVNFYHSEADARAAQNHYRTVKFTIVKEWWAPRAERQAEGLLDPFIEVAKDFAEHVLDPKALLWVPVEVVRALASRPLALQLFMLVYPRTQSTRDWWEMPFEELVELLNETERPTRKLMGDVQGALQEIHAVTGDRLQVRLVEAAPERSAKGGRPKKRWALRFGPDSKSLTRAERKTIKG